MSGHTHIIMCGVSEDHVKCHSQSAVSIVVTANQRIALALICKQDLRLPLVKTGPDLLYKNVRKVIL